ncbi:transporter [Bradyrhizobium manausense]|uniref:SphA family protein n=1 Tax=Bradyrhizobium TaxID=374 RepID=UPI001BAE20D9|nr:MULTISPECIES: transporter [Bradyrhizobium]MBR0828277.1 transporter [Bradyrhizobium manausense]UVO25647.1 transporter [Bradyrhizobium arachidis]
MQCLGFDLGHSCFGRLLLVGAAVALLPLSGQIAHADEGGVSFWLPGQVGSLAAVPSTPGWTLDTVYYHASVAASGSVSASRQIAIGNLPTNANVSLNANLNARADQVVLAPTYAFANSVLGGQLAIGMAGSFSRVDARLDGTLTAQLGSVTATRTGTILDSFTSVGDLSPIVTLKWGQGVHNWVIYGTGDIPVGAYDRGRLSNIGIGHGAIDGGGGYTYFNSVTGREFSAIAGFTYNFQNQQTQYQNGIDFHFDWGASQYLSKQLFIGLVGYAYQQVTADSGQHPILGPFKSRVIGIGPQIGYIFPIGKMQGSLNLRGYGEFLAAHRASGWNTFLTFEISGGAPEMPTRHPLAK